MATWLHVSDFHIRGGDPYDRDVVLRALVASVRRYRERGRKPDLIFATGDVAHSGKPAEYELATAFFDALLAAADLDRRHLFVIPGNHDVDRDLGEWLLRTLESREQVDRYFRPTAPQIHLTQKLGAFRAWHDQYFAGLRAMPDGSTCGPVEAVEVGRLRLGVLPINTCLFCQDDADHAKLLVGRRCLDRALETLGSLQADLNVALLHHPLEWLSDLERSNIRAGLQANVDVILRGHLHETDVAAVVSPQGGSLHVAAGAAYQTRRWPNRALYAMVAERALTLFPIRYEDEPQEVWTIDPSLFPWAGDHQGHFEIPRLSGAGVGVVPPARPQPPSLPRFHSNIPSRRDLPFVGRDKLLDDIRDTLGNPSVECTLVLHGPPGVGKSELAREFARRNRDRYPGGAFFIDAGTGAMVDLVRVGLNHLALSFPPGLSLQDQGEQTLLSFGQAPVLLIYDNAHSAESVQPLLPRTGMPCHVLVTTLSENWGPGWRTLAVEPLSSAASLELIEQLAGREVAVRHGQALVHMAEGLPVQICPSAVTLAYEARRGRLDSFRLTVAHEARESFGLVYEHLDPRERLLLHAAAFLNSQRLSRGELSLHLQEGAGWSEEDVQRSVDACMDLHLLEGGTQLRMHQLLARVLRATKPSDDLAGLLARVRKVQRDRFVELARGFADNPAQTKLAALLNAFELRPGAYDEENVELAIEEVESVGRALSELGLFTEALPWLERAIAARERGDGQGDADPSALGVTMHQVGYCLSEQAKYEEALPWYKRAIDVLEKGRDTGGIDHESLGRSLHMVGWCLAKTGNPKEARVWYERAVEAGLKGDAAGRVDYASLGATLHQVGWCLSEEDEYEEALAWYRRAVEAGQRGDVDGRVDHEMVATSMHQVGLCLWGLGKSDEALVWYQNAVESAQKGDLYGRVDHESVGSSLNWVGQCLADSGKHGEALAWYERALESKKKGDLYGRVDPESQGSTLGWIGWCLAQTGRRAEAVTAYQQAVEAKRKGDRFGCVDSQSVAKTLRWGAGLLRTLDRSVEAQAWEDEAAQLDPPA